VIVAYHLLLLGCNTATIADGIRGSLKNLKDMAKSPAAEEKVEKLRARVHVAYTTDTFNGGCVPLVIYAYGMTGHLGVNGSLDAHQDLTKSMLDSWDETCEVLRGDEVPLKCAQKIDWIRMDK